MPEFLSPGVFVEEIRTGTRSIEGVGTATAGFLGMARRGPVRPTPIRSWPEYQQWFGGHDIDRSYLSFAVEGFFANGGKRCVIARITAGDASYARLTLGGLHLVATGPGAWGSGFTHFIDQYTHMAGMWLVGEDMPQESNRITLHASEKDAFGVPIPNVHFDDHKNDEAMREHAYQQGSAVYDAAGAKETFRTPPYPSTHNLGTCRMSAEAKDGVCDGFGQTHDISNLFISDGSQFTTGAAENPTLTIITLAIRQADRIAELMKQRAI